MTHQVGLLKEQKFRILRFRLFSPLIKGLLIDNALTDFLVIKLVNHAVVHQHIRTTRLVFHLADVVDHGDVVLPERGLAFEFFFYQSSANKDLSRGFGSLREKSTFRSVYTGRPYRVPFSKAMTLPAFFSQ